MDRISAFIIVIISAIIHEISHGVVAEKFGDPTARQAGRITFNPIVHIDWFYTILLPLSMIALGSPVVFGAAKGVPVDFDRLRPRRWGTVAVSLAGVASNLLIAILCALAIKLGLSNYLTQPILIQTIVINLLLMTFNLIPIPPLDGSKVVAAFLPHKWMTQIFQLERFGFILVYIFLFTGALEYVLYPVLYIFTKIFGL